MTTATQPFTGTFTADPVHSSFQFAVRHMNVALFRAGFDDVEARLVVDEGGARITGAARVESISITKPPEFREHVVNGAEFFDAGNHPEITVTAEDLALAGDGTLTATGELTIRGVSRPVRASGTYRTPTEDAFGGTRIALEVTTTVDRREWGMDWQAPLPGGGDALAHEVEITAHLEMVQEG